MIPAAVRQFFVKSRVTPCRIAAAVSGGVDSTALLLALAELREDGFELLCAHVNHHLRGADSDADEAFVRELCTRFGIELQVADGTLDEERVRERGIEAAAREVRYARLAEIREQTGAHYVATAHQQNDQAETVLMRLLTGSGLAGLRGIHPIRDDGFIRPLLDVTRDDIERFVRERGITPCDDRSNHDPRFLRNRVRAILRELGGIGQLASIATQARETWPLLERAILKAERAHVRATKDATRFLSWPDEQWLRGALLQRHIRRLDPHARDFDAERLATELESIRRVHVTKTLELVREDDGLTLRRISKAQPIDFEVELTSGAAAYIPELGLNVHVARRHENQNAECRMQNAELKKPFFILNSAFCILHSSQPIHLPPGALPTFLVRPRRPGDRFHPLGMAQPKKLKDFLIDRKIPADVRDRLPLVVWNGEIVWVAGVEVSEAFKVTVPGAGELYELWLEGAGAAADESDQSRLQR